MGYCPEEDERHQTKQYRPLKAEARCKNYLNYSKCNSVASCGRWAFGGCPLMTAVRPVGCHLEGGVGCYLRAVVEAWGTGEFGTWYGVPLICAAQSSGPWCRGSVLGLSHLPLPPPPLRCYHWGCSGLGCGCCHGAGDAGHLTFRAV